VVLGWTLAAIFGTVAGAAVAWQISGSARGLKGIGPAPWYTAPNLGDASTDALTRAVVSRTGIWALPPSEVVYFVADEDEAGQPLRQNCVYELVGNVDPPARWWSVSLYRDNFWIDNPDDRYSFSKTSVSRSSDGRWRVRVAAARQAGNWLPMGDRPGAFSLSVRLYQPDPSVVAEPTAVPLPSLKRLSCV